MTTQTIAVGKLHEQLLTTVLEHLKGQPGDDHVADYWQDVIEQAQAAPRGGTLRAWMTEKHDEVIDTYQIDLRQGEADLWFITGFWTPGSRRVDAARATRVLLDGSGRYYSEVTTHRMTDTVYVGFSDLGEGAVQMVVFSR